MAMIIGTSGADQLTGTTGDDTLDGGAGNDTLTGGLGSDTYLFGYGYGHDRVFNEEPDENQALDRILLNPGVSPDDVVLSSVTLDNQGNPIPESLLLTLRSTGETLLVYGNFTPSPRGYLSASVNSIEFADGTIWGWMEVERRSREIVGTPGDDVLIGSSGSNLIMGGAGNDVLDGREWEDFLIGESGSDTYVFGRGYGNDTVYNFEPEWDQSIDRIRLNPDVTPQDVTLSVVTVDGRGMTIPASLLLTLNSTGETMLVREQFASSSGVPTTSAIDFIEFADGTVWDRIQIQTMANYVAPPILGTLGDDLLLGTPGDDIIDGGAGNDVLVGMEGADTYLFGQGYGHDRIHNMEDATNQSVDRIRLNPDVSAQDVVLSVVTQDHNGWAIPPSLQLRLRSTGDTLLVIGHFDDGINRAPIDFIEFADGTVWDLAEIERRAHLIEGTPGDDILYGTPGDDVIDGGAGNDYLQGFEGSDTYVFGYGYGHDRISNGESEFNLSIDRIRLTPGVQPEDVELREVVQDVNGFHLPSSLQLRLRSTGETLVVLGSVEFNMGNDAIDFIDFADGTVWDKTEIERRTHLIEGTAGDDVLFGTTGNDVIDGGAGNDQLIGLEGADTYIFGQGYGHDQLHNFEDPANQAIDRIRLKPDVTVQDVVLSVVSTDANGWGIPPSLRLSLRSTGETFQVYGHFDPNMNTAIDFIEFADGTVWDLAEIERRTHLIEGTAGDDVLFGTTGNDVIDGGAGNDQLIGLEGADTYIFGQGYGHDQLHNFEDPANQAIDRIRLKPDVTVQDVVLSVVSTDANGFSVPPSLRLSLRSTGETLQVYGHFEPNMNTAIDFIEFADGTVWDLAEIERRAHLIEGTAGDDVLFGTTGNDVIDGGAGNDQLIGFEGADTYVFGQGYGHDQIHNFEDPANQSIDRIRLNADVSAADVVLSVVSTDANGWGIPPSLRLSLRSTGESLQVYGHFDPNMNSAIDFIEFADGTVWDLAEIERRTRLIEGTPGSDVLFGTTGNDIFDGGAGNDTLFSSAGSDTYVFGRGYGHDLVFNAKDVLSQTIDRILLNPDVTPQDVELSVVNEPNSFPDSGPWPSLQLKLRSTGETLLVHLNFASVAGIGGDVKGIDFIEFADGTVWDKAEIQTRASQTLGTTGGDLLMGTRGDDIIDGGAGNDVLAGFAGNDTYVFGHGYGNDQIRNFEDPLNPSVDRIRLNPDVTVQDVMLRAIPEFSNGDYFYPASLELRLVSTGETLRVYGHFDPTMNTTVGFIEFADGTVWDLAEIDRRAHLIQGTAGDDRLYGTPGDDVIDGGAGNDLLVGFEGSDTYVFGKGYGHDRIDNYEFSLTQSVDRIRLNPSVSRFDVLLSVVTKDANGLGIPPSLQLKLLSTGETLLVLNHFDPNANAAIDFIEFADGTVWDLAEIDRRAHPIMGTAGNDMLSGTSGGDVIDGGAGRDTMSGGLGDDVYMVDDTGDIVVEWAGAGTDLVLSSVPFALGANIEHLTLLGSANISGTGNTLNNMLTGNSGINTLNGGAGDDILDGGAGNDYLIGGDGNDILIGGAGNDRLDGGRGNDTYVFNLGDGQDTVIDLDSTPGNIDTLRFGTGISANELNFARSVNDLLINVGGGTDQVRIQNWGSGGMNRIERIEFADGTVWDAAQIATRTAPLLGAPIIGTAASEVLQAWQGENANMQGLGGNDNLLGNDGNDTLDGGTGSDYLVGGAGSDTYIMGRGYGADRVQENDNTPGNTDVLQFLSGVATNQLWFRRVSSDLEVRIIGTSDRVTVVNWYQGNQYHVEQFKTSDGQTLLDTKVQNLVQAMAAFAPPPAGQTTLSPSYAAALTPVIAANWQ